MKKIYSFKILIVCLGILISYTELLAQQPDMQALLNQVKRPVALLQNQISASNTTSQVHLNPLLQLQERSKRLSRVQFKKPTGTTDTIFVGLAPNDTLTITGNYNHTGPIVVLLNGVLIIKKATVTNLGDLIAINNGKIVIDSSTVNFPQAYFYQRAIILVNKANATISNTTLTYGGFSHNLVVADSAQISFTKVTQPDWMTTGLTSKAYLTINHTNQVGEIIIADHTNLNVKNATNCLLWHQIPDTAVLNWSFGKRDTAYKYQFNNTQPGVKGVEYNVTADSVYQVMWALMPSSGSTINIVNSKIRSIGLWFDKPKDSVIVSGITDNAIYSAFTAPLSDRTLTFSNCTVQTWSFYVFHKSVINVSGCIAGEIGTENGSKMYGNNYMVDGSGGYHWTSDTSMILASNATVNSYVRSEKSGFFIFAYGTVGNSGGAEAIDGALLIVVQSLLPADPTAINGGDAWFDNINQTGNLFADSIAPINGSAWIHPGPTSNWMKFKSWQLFYQPVGATNWTAINGINTTEVSNSLLANWNTAGLNSGVYDLDLRIHDSWGDSVDAIKQVTLLPLVLGINELNDLSGLNLYPNPADRSAMINFNSAYGERVQISVTDITGKQEFTNAEFVSITGKNAFQLNTSLLPNGTYVCRITTSKGSVQRLLEISR
jgi:hypothetical protein